MKSPIETTAKKIAKAIIKCRIYDTEKRWIWHSTDLTAADKAEINDMTGTVQKILCKGNGRPWSVILDALHKVSTESFFLGFKEQDKIIAECAKCGIRFK